MSVPGFGGTVVADDLRFRARFGIGAEGYRTLRLGRRLSGYGGLIMAALAGTAIASSPWIASRFGGDGFLFRLGLLRPSTPLPWVIAAAVLTALIYGISRRLLSAYEGRRVIKVPVFVNASLDKLGREIVGHLTTLAALVGTADGRFDDEERLALIDYLKEAWGIDEAFARRQIKSIARRSRHVAPADAAADFARLVKNSPDCNAASCCREAMTLLREVAEADGRLDPAGRRALAEIEIAFSRTLTSAP